MSILTKSLPDYVTILDKNYKINTDFKVWLSVEGIIFNSSLSMSNRIAKVLSLCYIELPPALEEALEAIIKFYTNADEIKASDNTEGVKGRRSFSFEYDAPYIYCAFYKEYGIDLLKTDMHWWTFLTLLKGIGNDNRLCEIIKYRTYDISKIKNKDERAFYAKQKQKYRLPDTRSEEDMERDLGLALENLF